MYKKLNYTNHSLKMVHVLSKFIRNFLKAIALWLSNEKATDNCLNYAPQNCWASIRNIFSKLDNYTSKIHRKWTTFKKFEEVWFWWMRRVIILINRLIRSYITFDHFFLNAIIFIKKKHFCVYVSNGRTLKTSTLYVSNECDYSMPNLLRQSDAQAKPYCNIVFANFITVKKSCKIHSLYYLPNKIYLYFDLSYRPISFLIYYSKNNEFWLNVFENTRLMLLRNTHVWVYVAIVGFCH